MTESRYAAERRPKEESSMRIVIDLNRCQGYAQCVPLAPDVLKLHGEEAVMYDPNPDDSQRQRVLRAAASCPVQAIMLDMHAKAKATGS
jgi:ferredoxin